eukprot:3581973-Rhodomonas_salina.2
MVAHTRSCSTWRSRRGNRRRERLEEGSACTVVEKILEGQPTRSGLMPYGASERSVYTPSTTFCGIKDCIRVCEKQSEMKNATISRVEGMEGMGLGGSGFGTFTRQECSCLL